MPKKKDQQKRPIEMTSDELARHMFGAQAAAELKMMAAGDERSDDGDNSAYPDDNRSQ